MPHRVCRCGRRINLTAQHPDATECWECRRPTRSRIVRCEGCGREVAQGKRGPVRHWCESCRTRRSAEKRAVEAVCLKCGKTFQLAPDLKGYCSRECWRAAPRVRTIQPRVCANLSCGRTFTPPTDRQVACSLACKHALQRRHASTEDRYRARDSRRRARMADLPSEPYSLADLGTECWLCGGSVDMTLSGTAELGPTVDHIIPIFHGGWNVRLNVALAHRRCNRERGRRVVFGTHVRLDLAMWCTPRNVEKVRLVYRPELLAVAARDGLALAPL